MDSSSFIHLALASVITLTGFSLFFYVYNSVFKSSDALVDQSSNRKSDEKKEDKKSKDKKEKNKKPSRKDVKERSPKNSESSMKSDSLNQQIATQAKKSSSSTDDTTLKSPNKSAKPEKSSNSKTKKEKNVSDESSNLVNSSTASSTDNNTPKKNNHVDEEKKAKNTPRQNKKQLSHMMEMQLQEDVESPKMSQTNKSIAKSTADKELNTSSSPLNLEVDISITKLVEIIKTVALSNEEIQVIIEALLGRNTESDWINKNDPITVLKKQLEEKEQELKNETENYERAKTRIAAMRDEFNLEKQKYITFKEQASLQTSKCEQLEAKIKKFETEQQDQMVRLQANYSKMHKKIVDDLQNRIQEELSKSQQTLNQLESEKAKLNVLSFQVIQLSNDRQKIENLKLHADKQIETLTSENQSLKEKINLLEKDLQMNEYNFKQQLFEKDENYQNMISKIEAKSKELNSNVANAVQLQCQLEQLNSENKQLNDEQSGLSQQLSSLQKEKRSVVKMLSEIIKINNEDNLTDDLQMLVSNYKSAIDQQSNTKDETKKLKDRLNDEVKKTSDLEKQLEKMKDMESKEGKMKELETKLQNLTKLDEVKVQKIAELEKKIRHFEDTLQKADKDLDKIGKTADQEFKNWTQRVEKSEKAYLDVMKEHEKLKKESSSLMN